MPAIIRSIIYASIFVAIVFVVAPAHLLTQAGISGPEQQGLLQYSALTIVTSGAIVAFWSVVSFALFGKGTPAPFDPPRTLVVRGPYRFVRNPMYIGGGLVLAGTALYFESVSAALYSGLFIAGAHVFVVFYEEPTLRRMFGTQYEEYCSSVRRWWPRFHATRYRGIVSP
jgi:protein-S-isoprenylcysteine O-methyltransferase Ste14